MKKIKKDVNAFVNFRLATILLVFILLLIAAPIYWFFMLQKKKKAKPVINNPYDTGGNNLLLTVGQFDDGQASSGYQYAQLGQPCSKNGVNKGLPNLPGSYIPMKCDPTKNLVCTSDNYQGDICLTEIGGFCNTVNDCTEISDLCLNNICSESKETLNRKCISDTDCKGLLYNISDTTLLFNHVCDIEGDKKYGFCKVNNYPFDSGCNDDNDCLTGYNCSKTPGSFDISITGGGSWFAFDTEGKNIFTNFDLKNKIVLINNNTYQIADWTYQDGNANGTLKLVNSKNFPQPGTNNKLSLGAAKDGICLGKIPEAGPANLTIGGINIPCKDGLQNINDYCLSTTTPNIGEVCLDKANSCQDYNINGANFGLSCLYDYNTEQDLINDYYYNLEDTSFAKSIFNSGKCARPVRDRGQGCNDNFYGCSFPYTCIAENNEEGVLVNICNIPFEAQICTNNNCPYGYECKINSDNEPLCYSKSGTMCIENTDCSNSKCGDGIYLQVYNPEDTKIKKLDWPTSQYGQTTIHAYNPKLNKNIIPNSKELVVANNILSWSQDNNNNLNIILLQDNNKIIKKGCLNFSSGTIVKDVVMDEDENIIILYKRPVTETIRERVFKMDINSNISTTKLFNLDQFNGLIGGTVVYYFYSGNNQPVLDSYKLYKLTKLPVDTNTIPVTYGLTDQEGSAVNYNNGAVDDGHHWLITYDNNYEVVSTIKNINNFALTKTYDPENENNRYLQLNTGDRVTPFYLISSISYQLVYGSIKPINKTLYLTSWPTFGKEETYYLTAMGKLYPRNINFDASTLTGTINTNNPDAIYYTISDDYYHSIGGFPSLDNNKTFNQTLYAGTPGDLISNGYFKLNYNNLYTYSITSLRTTDLIEDTEIKITNDNYVYDNNKEKFDINGINQGITFLYDGDDDIEINTKKLNNKNYLILNKGISTAVNNNAGSKYINQIMKYQYNIEYDLGPSISSKNSFDYVFKTQQRDTNAGTCYSSFYFNYPEVNVVDESKGFYHSGTSTINRDNNIENISINENESIFYTLRSDDNLNNNIENTVGINSGYTKLSVSTGSVNEIEPDINYQNDGPNKFSNLKPLEFSSLVNLINRKGNENYYIDDNSYIYIYDQTDIDNILNFSSSELVLTKLGDTPITSYATASGDNLFYPGNSKDSYNQLTLAITEISEYNVTVDSEYIKAKIHIDINYEETNFILDSKNPWQLNVYNYVPLQFYAYFNNLKLADDNNGSRNVSSFTYNINDASLLYSSTKGTSFFDNKQVDGISRTGYNKILTLNTQDGYDTNNLTININSTSQDTGSIYYVTDGAGVFMTGTGSDGGWGSDNKVSQPQNFYNITSQISYVGGDSYLTMITCYPSNMPYQNFLVLKGNNTYDILKYAEAAGDSNTYYEDTTNDTLDMFNSFFGDRFFVPFVPISSEQLSHANGNVLPNTNPDEFNYVPLRTQYPPQPVVYKFPTDDTTQFVLSTNQKIPAPNNAKFYYRQLYSGTIKLPFINIGGGSPDGLLYTVNNMFLTSFDTNTWYLNSNSYKKDNIIITTTTDKNGKSRAMVKGNIPTYQNMMAHYQTGTVKPDDALNKSNQVAITWPSWFKTRYDNKLSVNNAIPKIKRIIIDHSNGNTYGNANYYAFIETEDEKTILVYLNNENTNYDLGENQGIPTTISIYKNELDYNFLKNKFVMSSPSKLLYILSNICD